MPSNLKSIAFSARRFAAGLALGAMLLAASAVSATVVPLTMEQMLAVSDEVVAVRVTDTTPEFANGIIVTKAKFTVLDNFKGTMQGEQELTMLGGVYKGLSMQPGGLPSLEKGEEAILFLSNPYNRMSAAQKSSLKASSPLTNKLTFVGGWQGKLLIAEDEDPAAGAKSAAPVKASAKVTRAVPGATMEPQAAQAPDYGRLSSALKGLASAQKAKAAQKAAPKKIAGINGSFVVPDRSSDAAVRAFDPLPSFAYLSDKELDALDKKVKEKSAAQKAAPSTGAKAPGEE